MKEQKVNKKKFAETLYLQSPLAWRGYEIERMFEGMGERKDWTQSALLDVSRTLRLPEDDLRVAAIWFRLQRQHKETNLPWEEPERDRNRVGDAHRFWTLFYFAFLDSLRYAFNPYFRRKGNGRRTSDEDFRCAVASEVICQLTGGHGKKLVVSRQGDSEGYRKIAEHAKQDDWLGKAPTEPEAILALSFLANGWAAFRAEPNADDSTRIADSAAAVLHKVAMDGLAGDFRYSADEYERRALFFMLAQRLYVVRDIPENSRERMLFAALYLDFYRRPLSSVFMRKSFRKAWCEIPFDQKEDFAAECRKLLVKTRNEAIPEEDRVKELLKAVPDDTIEKAVDFICTLPNPTGIATAEESGACAAAQSKFIHEQDLDDVSRQIGEGARLYAKKAIRERFAVLENSPFGQGAKCLFIKEIKTDHDFADFLFYWGKLIFAVQTNAIVKGKSLLSEERRKFFLEVCEKNGLHPLLFRVNAELVPSDQSGDGATVTCSAGGMNGWGFFDYQMGMETDAGMMMAFPQPEGDVRMSEIEIQAIACSALRMRLTNSGCQILKCNNWPGVLGSVFFQDPNGVVNWVYVDGVAAPREEPDLKEILSRPECADYVKMPGVYAQIVVGDGKRGTEIRMDFHTLHPIVP